MKKNFIKKDSREKIQLDADKRMLQYRIFIICIQVEEIYGGIALPVITLSHAGDLRGGIYNKELEFVAGFLRHGEDRFAPGNPGYYGINEEYKIEEKEMGYFSKDVIFGGILINYFGLFKNGVSGIRSPIIIGDGEVQTILWIHFKLLTESIVFCMEQN